MGAGLSLLPPDLLLRYRGLVDRPETGRELASVLRGLETSGAQVGGQSLRRVPLPFATDHERGELLKRLGLVVARVEALPCAIPRRSSDPRSPSCSPVRSPASRPSGGGSASWSSSTNEGGPGGSPSLRRPDRGGKPAR